MEALNVEPEDKKLQAVAHELQSLESRGERQTAADGRTDSCLLAATVASVVGGLDEAHTQLLRALLLGAPRA